MANVDEIDEILDGLSYEDLQTLSEEIDPEVCLKRTKNLICEM